MRNEHTEPDEGGLSAPPKLVSALKGLPQERLFIPPTLDESVLRTARQHLTSPAGVRRPWAGWLRACLEISRQALRWALAGVGAMALLVVILVWPGKQKSSRPLPAIAAEDLNRDGRVDILDAFILAKELNGKGGAPNVGGTAPASLPDVNGDGRLDSADVAVIAAHAVKLDKGGRS